jgi:NADH dehydrogenase FAD-containing subunit
VLGTFLYIHFLPEQRKTHRAPACNSQKSTSIKCNVWDEKFHKQTATEQQQMAATAFQYQNSPDGKTKVVIIGAGPAGLFSLKTLLSTVGKSTPLHIVLVDKREYTEVTPLALRFMVDPSTYDKFSFDHSTIAFKQKGHSYQIVSGAEAQSLDTNQKQVTINKSGNNYTLAYDYLIIGTGTAYSTPYIKPTTANTREARKQEINEINSKLLSSQNTHVVVVGGGAVGVELVGELCDLKQKKNFKITLVHNNFRLVERTESASFHKYATSFFKRHQVDVILENKVLTDSHDYSKDFDPSVKKQLTLSSGKTISDATIVFWCLSSKPATEWLRSSSLDFEGDRLKVNDTLQSTSDPSIFIAGDANNAKCEKLSYTAKLQAAVVAQNLNILVQNNRSGKSQALKNFVPPPGPVMGLVSLGQNDGGMIMKQKMMLWGKLSVKMKRFALTEVSKSMHK